MIAPTPSGWITSTLGDCCTIVSGGTPKREKPEYWNGVIPWVTPKDISNLDCPDFFDPPEKISELGLKKSSATLLPTGAVLLSSRAPIGLLAIAGQPMATNQGFKSLVPGPELDSRFLYYAVKRLVPIIQERGSGATFKEVSKSVVSEVPISYPRRIEEQEHIAAILDKADSVRRKREQALVLAEEFLRSWFLHVFGDPRRIGDTGIVLDDIAIVARGRFSPRPRNDPQFYGGDFPFIQTGEIANADGYLTSYRQTLNEKGIKVSKSFPKGTVFVAIVGATIGATAISSRELWCPDSVIGIESQTEDYPAEFIEYLLRFWRPVFVAHAPETARANINLQTLKPVPIPRAKNGEARKFGQLYRKTHAIKSRLSDANFLLLFDSLSQRAFRGEL